ncbi:hypothetical protein K439DRAFT_804143 [Ramaria rubella]|nr:hypothetical protein K439DRAFT_804143 [Ramaria rubella]
MHFVLSFSGCPRASSRRMFIRSAALLLPAIPNSPFVTRCCSLVASDITHNLREGIHVRLVSPELLLNRYNCV